MRMNGSTNAERVVYNIKRATDATVKGKSCIILKVRIENQNKVDIPSF